VAPLTRRCLGHRRPLPRWGEADWTAACAGRTPRGTPKGAWVPAFAGMTPAGFLLAQESHCGPLTRRCLRHRRPLPRWGEADWTAACAAVTRGAVQRSLDSYLRGNHTGGGAKEPEFLLVQEGHCGPPHPAVPWAPPASPAVGRGGLDCCLRRNDTGTPSPGHPGRVATLSRKGRGGLGSCLRGNHTVAPSPGGALGTAGLSRGGERRTGLLLTQE
jgi:hypothetical protein